ncbi:DUF669 domain-containing protein [Luteibacter yeojuensis]|uniref:DUF669 domain-containing protein n=1 Tax=Luteibacter yeojuensis TaxID=345309 RepID=A0A7X5QS35_9GAMM|nr:DUF669 domain-containing protein [Luteibacter yeojuensis]NID14334.1 DUF669 domain-containing protein [Luteibacter yeojuensis]
MANLNSKYDPNAESQTAFNAIPTGEYPAVIVDSDMKPTKRGDGEYLELAYEITEGQYKGRKLWARLNLKSTNSTAQEIANRQFASIREVTGVANPVDSQELHFKPHVIRVEYIPAGTEQKNGYVTDRDSNEIKAWKRLSDGVATNSAPSSAPAANNQPASPTPPWANKAA